MFFATAGHPACECLWSEKFFFSWPLLNGLLGVPAPGIFAVHPLGSDSLGVLTYGSPRKGTARVLLGVTFFVGPVVPIILLSFVSSSRVGRFFSL